MSTTTIIKPDGSKLIRKWKPRTQPDLAWLQKACQGYIEKLPGSNYPNLVYFNEDGRSMGLKPNDEATRKVDWPYPLLGNVVFLKGFNEGDEAIDPCDMGKDPKDYGIGGKGKRNK